jgi:hypothetical protein
MVNDKQPTPIRLTSQNFGRFARHGDRIALGIGALQSVLVAQQGDLAILYDVSNLEGNLALGVQETLQYGAQIGLPGYVIIGPTHEYRTRLVQP